MRTAGPANHAPAGAVQGDAATDQELIQLFVPPSDVKGGPEKLPLDTAEKAAERGDLLEVVN